MDTPVQTIQQLLIDTDNPDGLTAKEVREQTGLREKQVWNSLHYLKSRKRITHENGRYKYSTQDSHGRFVILGEPLSVAFANSLKEAEIVRKQFDERGIPTSIYVKVAL